MTLLNGLDVSNYQNGTPSLAGQSFLIAKATEGLTYADPTYHEHTAAAVAAGRRHGAYHFGHSGLDPVAQAAYLVAHAPDAQFYALDSEGATRMTPAEETAFFAALGKDKPGVKRLLYESLSGFDRQVGQDANWVADWGNTPPNIPFAFWQYTSNGSMQGYAGRLDLDHFNGDQAALDAFCNVAPPHQWQLHIAAGTKVVYYVSAFGAGGCIAGWTSRSWQGNASSAPCRAPVVRPGCSSGSAKVAYVTAGVFAGKFVRLSGGVSAS
jgi:hypothetical protein